MIGFSSVHLPVALIHTISGRSLGRIIDYESGRFQVVMVLLRVSQPIFCRPKKDYKYNKSDNLSKCLEVTYKFSKGEQMKK